MTEKGGNDAGIDRQVARLPADLQAQMRKIWSDEEWASLSIGERHRLSAWVVQLINSDIVEAMAAGSFDARADSHTSRTVSLVDEQGWRELTRIQADALEANFAVQAASAERLAESGEEGVTVLSAMICCELPPPGGGPAA